MNKDIEQLVATSVIRTHWPDPNSGQAIVLAGGYFVTAAHCLPTQHWTDGVSDGDPLMAQTPGGDEIPLRPLFSDCCQDLAVLTVFEDGPSEWLREIKPLTLRWSRAHHVTSGHLHTHDRGLISVSVEVPQAFVYSPRVAFTASASINGGSSGGPCLTEDGQVLSLVSFTGSPDHCTGYGPLISACLPRWLAAEIRRAERFEE